VGDGRRAAVLRELDLVVTDARRMIRSGGDLDEVECEAADVRTALQCSRQPALARQVQPS
jgi:hypothetical protein